MLSSEKSGLLQALLGSLPGATAARLARAVEVDRLMDGTALPHNDILSSLRPALRGENRTPTPLRLFCAPFQDLLTSAPRTVKQKAVIARASVVPVWQWLGQTLIPAECASFLMETKAAILAQQFDVAQGCAARFHRAAGAAITAALSSEKGRAAARSLLADELVIADAEEIALLLSAAEAMRKVQQLMPVAVPGMDDKLLRALHGIYDDLAKTNPDAAPYIAAMAMNRLARPWEALKLPMLISRRSSDTLISRTDIGLVGEILISRLDGLKAFIETVRHPYFDPGRLIDAVRDFAILSTAMVREMEIRRNGEWGRRLIADRKAVGAAMEALMERAPREFAGALPMSRDRGAEFSHPADPERQDLARRYARLVAGCRGVAGNASFGAKQRDADQSLCTHLKRYAEDAVKALREPDAAKRSVVETQFALCVECAAILFSAAEAELLRRRGSLR